MGICLGPNVEIKKIFIDSEEVFSGDQLSQDGFEETESDDMPFGTNEFISYATFPIKPIIEAEVGYSITDEQLDEILEQGEIRMTQFFAFRFFGPGGSLSYVPETGQTDLALICIDENDLALPVPGFPLVGDAATYFISGNGASSQTLKLQGDLVPGTRKVSVGARIIPSVNIVIDYEVFTSTYILELKGSVRSTQNFDIFAPDLYGGEKSGGGHIGNVTFYPGTFDQGVDPDIEASAGSGNVPAYRGMCHMAMPDQYIGESPQLRAIEFLVGKFSNLLSLGNDGKVGETEDLNPAEAIYYMMTDEWAGLNVPTNQIDIASFQAAGAVLETEGNGCSISVSTTKNGKSIINEVLRQIDGVLVQDDNNLVALKLIRNDYDPDELTTYDENDIIKVSGYTKTSWRDVKSRVKLSFSTRDKEGTRIAEAQNMATMGMIGRVNGTQITMPFCYEPMLANTLAHRELAQLSTPLLRMTLTMNRNGFQLRTGDVFKVDWPEYGITDLVVRAQKVDLGELNSNEVEIEVVQDIFAINTVVFGAPEDSGWTNDRPEPATEVENSPVEMPRFFQTKLESPIEDGFGSIIPFSVPPTTFSTSFNLSTGTLSTVLEVTDLDDVVYPISGTIVTEYGELEGFTTGVDETTGIVVQSITGLLGETPSGGSESEIHSGDEGLLYINGEWMAFEGITDNMDGTYTLTDVYRGLLGTRALTHAVDDRIYFFNTALLDVSTIGAVLEEDGTIYYKVLDRVGAIVADEEDVTEESLVLTAQANRPLRPRNLQLDASRTLPVEVSGDTDLTWVASNRESDVIPFETDAAETPDQAEEYNVEVYIEGVLNATLSSDGETSPYTIPFSSVSVNGGPNNEVRVYAVRTVGDLRVSSEYATLPFSLEADNVLLSGDEQSGTDNILMSGDAQEGTDILQLSGDEA